MQWWSRRLRVRRRGRSSLWCSCFSRWCRFGGAWGTRRRWWWRSQERWRGWGGNSPSRGDGELVGIAPYRICSCLSPSFAEKLSTQIYESITHSRTVITNDKKNLYTQFCDSGNLPKRPLNLWTRLPGWKGLVLLTQILRWKGSPKVLRSTLKQS